MKTSSRERVRQLHTEISVLWVAWMIQMQTDNECNPETPGKLCSEPECRCFNEIRSYIAIAKGRMP
jgi:hypothetical protein